MAYTHRMSIRYGECDQQGVVFNANYLAYIDDAMDNWMRSIAADAWVSGWDVMLKTVQLTWHAPARWSETLSIDCGASRFGRTSFDVAYRLRVQERPVADALITYVSVAADTQEPTPPPAAVTAAMGELVTVPEALGPR